MRASVFYFTVTGAIGGAIGFGLMEIVRLVLAAPEPGAAGSVVDAGWLFAVFGLAVGAGLGATAGWYFRQRRLLLRGMVAGGVLGLLGGFFGGVFGQWIYNRVPIEYVSDSRSDIAVVLDSSGSMSGNDFWNKRQKASKKLIDRLSSNDRVAVVDFDDAARLAFPLTGLVNDDVRKQAKDAVESADNSGGTNLDAGLLMAIGELIDERQAGRPQIIIFLTDGEGQYTPSTAETARSAGITIHTVGLGSAFDPQILQSIASTTGGQYFGVAQASDLIATFEKIRVEAAGGMADQRAQRTSGEKQKTNPLWLTLARLLAWGAMGLVLGLGQGLRDNSWEDLKSCGFGGSLGGLIGGAIIEGFQLNAGESGLLARLLAGVLVGALIGGTLRLIKNASEERMAAAKIEKKAVFGGGLSVGESKKGTKLGSW